MISEQIKSTVDELKGDKVEAMYLYLRLQLKVMLKACRNSWHALKFKRDERHEDISKVFKKAIEMLKKYKENNIFDRATQL